MEVEDEEIPLMFCKICIKQKWPLLWVTTLGWMAVWYRESLHLTLAEVIRDPELLKACSSFKIKPVNCSPDVGSQKKFSSLSMSSVWVRSKGV